MPSLAIGPGNVAGQGYQWSEAVSREFGISSWSFAGTRANVRRIDGAPHFRIPHHRVRPRAVRDLWIRGLLSSRTHVLVESLEPLVGDPRFSLVTDELPFLESLGLSVGAVFHGSDVRSPARHMDRLSQSYFRLWDHSEREGLEERAAKRRAAADAMGLPCFVSTPDLLLDLPRANWLPLVIDSGAWATDRRLLENRRPVVMHIPSRRNPPIKGSDYIEPVLADLARQGLIDYRAPAGVVPHREMMGLVKGADIVVEQILVGSYGVAAVEAMAAGCVVIGYVGDQVRQNMPENPPIVDTTPEAFLDTMMQVIREPEHYLALAASGPGYVERIHSGSMSALSLGGFLGI